MASDELLQRIQALQFHDRAAAEALLLNFVREVFPNLDAQAVQLRPLAVSLNSFNGFLILENGQQLFFKTHVEPGSIVGEYYNTELLVGAGYPVIRPLYTSTEYGKQLLIYDLIDSPSVFDVAYAIDHNQPFPGADLTALTRAQFQADDRLLDIYLNTLEWQSAEDAARAPIHQLFYHRLGARYRQFYVGKPFILPGGKAILWEDLLTRTWVINDVQYGDTLGKAIEYARETLRPDRAGWSVIGHGDAHNGNVFFTPNGLVYFDPAFGGRHHPMLDLAKPMFHNVDAAWMYHPNEVADTLRLTFEDDGATIRVQHNYTPGPCRAMFRASKSERVYQRLIDRLTDREPDATRRLNAAMMCCPLLTMNLADRERFPPEVGLLGLSFAVEYGLKLIQQPRVTR